MFKKSKDKKNERHESQHHTTDVTALRNKTLSKYEEEFVVMKKNS